MVVVVVIVFLDVFVCGEVDVFEYVFGEVVDFVVLKDDVGEFCL